MLPFITNSQSLPAPEKAYEAAFNHIKHDDKLRQMGYNLRDISAFDSIVHLELEFFEEDVRELWGYTNYQKRNRLTDSLTQLREAAYHKPYFSPLTAGLTTNAGIVKGCTVVLFSRLDNNLLLAQVSDNQEGGPGLGNVLSTFDQSFVYLFMFDPEGRIQWCYSHLISHN